MFLKITNSTGPNKTTCFLVCANTNAALPYLWNLKATAAANQRLPWRRTNAVRGKWRNVGGNGLCCVACGWERTWGMSIALNPGQIQSAFAYCRLYNTCTQQHSHQTAAAATMLRCSREFSFIHASRAGSFVSVRLLYGICVYADV